MAVNHPECVAVTHCPRLHYKTSTTTSKVPAWIPVASKAPSLSAPSQLRVDVFFFNSSNFSLLRVSCFSYHLPSSNWTYTFSSDTSIA